MIGACPRCGGSDRFALWPAKNIWHCRGCGTGGDAIALEIHLSGGAFVDAVKTLIGKDAGTPNRRQPTSDEVEARRAREAERTPGRGRRGGAQRQQRSEDPRAPAADRRHAGRSLSARRPQDRCEPLGDQASVGGCRGRSAGASASASGNPTPQEPLHELHGQWLGAIIGILTDPVTGERTGGITRKLPPSRQKGLPGEVARRRWAAGDHPPVARRRGGGWAAHLRGDRVRRCRDADGLLPDVGVRLDIAWRNSRSSTASSASRSSPTTTLRTSGWSAGGARKSASGGLTPAARAVMKIPKRPGEDANDIIKRRARA